MSTPTAILSNPRKIKPLAKPLPRIEVSEGTIKGLTNFFDLLADASRLKILLALAQHGELHVSASAICSAIGRRSPPSVII